MHFTAQQYEAYQVKRAAKLGDACVVVGCEDESELQRDIIAYSRQQGWVVFHGSVAHRTYRTPGEPDVQVFADRSRVFLVECKTRVGKLSTEQLGVKMWLEKLGHTVHVVRSFQQFLEIVK